MKLVPVDPNEVSELCSRARGRVSYPILKMFMESNMPVAKLDRTGVQQSLQSLYCSLNTYAKNHDMPIKTISRGGELYLLRLDINADGKPNPDWHAGDPMREKVEKSPAREITDDIIDDKFPEQKSTTK